MRRSWFGDHRDFWKWTVTIEAARQNNADIVYVAMMQADKQSNVCKYDEAVVRFFRREMSDKHIKDLGTKCKVEIVTFLDHYMREDWETYFGKVVEHLRNRSGHRSVVLVDPDTGLWVKNSTSRHLRKDELQLIWEGMNDGDLLFVYQHQQRSNKWSDIAKSKIAAALQISESKIVKYECKDVCMLQVQRGKNY